VVVVVFLETLVWLDLLPLLNIIISIITRTTPPTIHTTGLLSHAIVVLAGADEDVVECVELVSVVDPASCAKAYTPAIKPADNKNNFWPALLSVFFISTVFMVFLMYCKMMPVK
jgi:hypothetical protein